ncbi:hypothetical protein ACP4OV_008062 [Aristida adscensionis]
MSSTGPNEGMAHPIEEHDQSQVVIPLVDQLQQKTREFWMRRQQEIEETMDFNEHVLPLAPLAEVFPATHDGMVMSPDTPLFLAKMCELFVQELSVRAWNCAMFHDRDTILDSDIIEGIAATESYHFLNDVLHRHGFKVTKEPSETNLDKEPTSNNATQILQEGLSLMTNALVVATSSIGFDGALPNSYDIDYSNNMANITDITISAICGEGASVNSVISVAQHSLNPSFILEKHEELVRENYDTMVPEGRGIDIATREGGNNKCNIILGDNEDLVEENTLHSDANHDSSATTQPDLEESINNVNLKISAISSSSTTDSK